MSSVIQHLPKYISEKAKLLEDVGIVSGKAELELILCHVLDVDNLNLYLHGTMLLTPERLARVEEIVNRRVTRYPLQFILEESWFFGRRFFVSPAVMVPTPETELLCVTAMECIREMELPCPKILDVGVGSGVISVTLANELGDCRITALDISTEAIEVARRNATKLGGVDKIEFRQSDFFSALSPDDRFDLILSNPPYISEDEYKELPPEVLADPKISLTSGDEGLDAIKVILRDAPNNLAPGGRIIFEIGYNQADRVAELTARDDRYESIVIMKDLNDIDRVVMLTCTEQ